MCVVVCRCCVLLCVADGCLLLLGLLFVLFVFVAIAVGCVFVVVVCACC